MNIKKCLSIFLSCAMLAQPSMANANQIPKKTDNSKPPAIQVVKDKMSACNDWLNANPKAKTGLKVVGIGASVYLGLRVLCRAGGEIWFNCASHTIPGLDRIETGGDHIKKQEGIMWCWNACLQRALHKYGIEKTQKEIFRGITNKRYVSPLKTSRGESNVLGVTRKERDAASSWLARMLLPDPVFNEEIQNYVEKVTEGEYTYQTVYVDWENIPANNDDLKGTGSIRLYQIYNTLRNEIAKKSQIDAKNVALLSLCPNIETAHMVTVENTRDSKFIMGEPMAGKTVQLANDKFFRRGPDFTPYVCSTELRTACPTGLPISFIIKKGSEITKAEWNKMLADVLNQKNQKGSTNVLQ